MKRWPVIVYVRIVCMLQNMQDCRTCKYQERWHDSRCATWGESQQAAPKLSPFINNKRRFNGTWSSDNLESRKEYAFLKIWGDFMSIITFHLPILLLYGPDFWPFAMLKVRSRYIPIWITRSGTSRQAQRKTHFLFLRQSGFFNNEGSRALIQPAFPSQQSDVGMHTIALALAMKTF